MKCCASGNNIVWLISLSRRPSGQVNRFLASVVTLQQTECSPLNSWSQHYRNIASPKFLRRCFVPEYLQTAQQIFHFEILSLNADRNKSCWTLKMLKLMLKTLRQSPAKALFWDTSHETKWNAKFFKMQRTCPSFKVIIDCTKFINKICLILSFCMWWTTYKHPYILHLFFGTWKMKR